MIKQTLTSVLLVFSFMGFAQSFSFYPTDSIVVNPPANTYSQYYIYQSNDSEGDIYLSAEIIYNDIPSTYDGMVCIEGACMGYFPPVGTIANMTPINDTSSGYVRLTINPFNYTDQASIRIRVFNTNKPADSDTATFILFSQPVGLVELVDDSRIQIFPNPAKNKLNINLDGTIEADQISIVDLNGNEVILHSLSKPSFDIDISNLASGVYIVQTLTNSGVINRQKIVVYE